MKKYILFLAIFISLKGFSIDLDILITTVDNEGAVSGVTYRIYAKKYDKNVTINGVVGTFVSPVVVRSTTSFYQSTYGGYSSQFVDEGNYSMDSTLLYDSWFTLGYETNQNNSLISLGGYFSQFENGDSLYMNNGCWFVPQDDPASNSGDCVLIGQFTTTGDISGTLNLFGYDENGDYWLEKNLRFDSSKSKIILDKMPGGKLNVDSNSAFIYPNPAKTDQKIIVEGLDVEWDEIHVINSRGELVSKIICSHDCSNCERCDSSILAPSISGVYLINVISANTSSTLRVLVE